MIGFNADQLHVLLGDQFPKQVEQLWIPCPGLTHEGERETDSQFHTLPHQLEKHASGRVVAVLRYFVKVALVHTFIEEAMGDIFSSGPAWNRLCRQFQAAWLMDNGVDCQICNHDDNGPLKLLCGILLAQGTAHHCWRSRHLSLQVWAIPGRCPVYGRETQ